MRCGLLGQHLGHSYSPQIHGMLADYEYSLFEKEPDELEDFLKNGAFDGLNVTIPYKQAVIPYLNDLTPIARELGAEAVCTLKKIRHNQPQSTLGGVSHRKANVLGAYRVIQPVEGKKILLLDDIVTTGATASECARTLLTAGAKEVKLAALAVASHETKRK